MGKINLKEELLKIDRQTNFKYTLTDLYEACMLDEKKKGKLVQYIEDRDIPSMSSMLSNEAGVMTENIGDDLSDDEMRDWKDVDDEFDFDAEFKAYLDGFGDIDSENTAYEYIRRKSVLDSDGFITDYTWYKDKNTGLNVFVFGDNEVYTPDAGYFDYETESDDEAEEWFNSYNGFADEDDLLDEGVFAVAGDALGKGVKDLWQGAKNFGKGLRDTGKDVVKTAKAVGKSVSDEFKQSKNAAKLRDATRALKGANNVDEFKSDYQRRQADRKISDTKRNNYYKGRAGKSYGDTQDWKYEVNGKKMNYDQFMKLPEEQRINLIKNKKVKCYDLSGKEITMQDQAKRLNASWLRESRQLNEGPGAGYSIETSGYNMSGTLNSFTMTTKKNRWGNTEYVFDCDVSLTGEVETFYAEAAYSHTGVQHDLPIVCDHITFEVGDDGLVALGIFSEADYEAGNLTENRVDKNGLYESIIDALSGARCSFTYGGGWSHSRYDGQVTEDYLSDVYLADVDASIYLSNEEDIRKVDRMTQGYGYETQYEVVIDGVGEECFEDESEAIEYAQDNGAEFVRTIYVTQGWDDDYDVESGSIVWEADGDVEESLNETFNMSINLDEVVCDVANMLDVDVLGEENWIEVFPIVDVRPLVGGGSYVTLEITGPNDDCRKATFTAKGGCVNVQFRNGSEAKCYGADEIARFIAGEFGVTLNESLKEAVGGAKTFSQWFDETSSDSREEFYPFANYVKTFPSAEALANATAEDIMNNAHQFYDVYDVDSADRERAFSFASEELDRDYDDFYYAWLNGNPIVNESLKEDWTHFEFKSGSNPYIAKDEREKSIMLKKYGDKAKEIKPNYYMVDDSEGDRDFFKVDESVEELSVGDKFEAKLPSGNLETFTVAKVLPDAYQVKERTKDGDMIYKVNKNQVTRKIDGELSEAFTPDESGIQSVKVYNQYNYTIQELRIDNDAKTFERGNFTMGKPDKKFKNRQQYEDLVDQLKELGYTEISSDYQSLRNKSRKGVPTNESKSIRESNNESFSVRFNTRNGATLKSMSKSFDNYEDALEYATTGDEDLAWGIEKDGECVANGGYGGRVQYPTSWRPNRKNEAVLPRNASRIRTTDRVSSTTRNMTKDSFGWRDDESGTYYSPNHIRKYHDVEVTETDPNYKPKRTRKEYIVQGNYGYGWDDLTASDSYGEAKQDLKDYRENEKNATHRLITRRVPIEEAFEKPDTKGPFWYLCKHGIGPGAIPKGVTVMDTMDDPDNANRCYVALDKALTTDELKQFEMKEQRPPMQESKTYKGIKERLNEDAGDGCIRFEVIPDNRKWQYFIGDKAVPYTSYEEAKSHLKDDFNIMDYRDELNQFIKDRGAHFFVDATFDDRLCIEINWGDWKHDHRYADYLVREFFNEKGLWVSVDEEVTEEDGSDTYSAIRYYDITDLCLSGKPIEEGLKEGNEKPLCTNSKGDYLVPAGGGSGWTVFNAHNVKIGRINDDDNDMTDEQAISKFKMGDIDESFKINEGYDIKNVNGHYEVHKDGKFVCSADTRAEAEKEIQELESNK